MGLWERLLALFRDEDYEAQEQSQVFDYVENKDDSLDEANIVLKYPEIVTISQMTLGMNHIHGKFHPTKQLVLRGGNRVTIAFLNDNTGRVKAQWFHRTAKMPLVSNIEYEVRGELTFKDGLLVLDEPLYRPLEDGCKEFNYQEKKPRMQKSKNKTHANYWDKDISGKKLDKNSSWAKIRKKVFERDNYHCVECGESINLTVDHIEPLSLGGSNEMSNLQTLCKDCHEDKHFRNFLDRNFDAINDYGENYEPTTKIKKIVEACRDKKTIRIFYIDRNGKETYRNIQPEKIYRGYPLKGKVVNPRMIYVNAYCELDDDNRTFRISRMKILE